MYVYVQCWDTEWTRKGVMKINVEHRQSVGKSSEIDGLPSG